MMYLLKSCIGNLSQYSLPSEIEDFDGIEDFFSEEEIKLFRIILSAASRG